jgi:hypothetical protein
LLNLHSLVIKIKKDLIHKAKVKKSYAKIKAREPPIDRPIREDTVEPQLPIPEPTQELHPERQAMLDAPEPVPLSQRLAQPRAERPRQRKPVYFQKEIEFAERKKAEAEERRLEFERRDKERKQKIEEREKYRSAMAKARTGGRNGQRKLGRESKVLLEKVKRVVGS